MEGLRVRIRDVDLIGAMCFAVSGASGALLSNSPRLVGVLLAIPLVFILPGYTLTQVLFRKRSADTHSTSSNGLILQPQLKIGQPFGAVDLIVCSLGLSLVIDVTIGLLLNLLPIGLQWQSWTLSLGLVTALFSLLAAFLRQRQPVKKRAIARWHITFKEYVLLGSALAVIALALWLSIIRLPPAVQSQPGFTQFWMLSSTQANNSCAVLIGAYSFEAVPTTYRIQVTSNGRQVASWPSITLTTQQEWSHLVLVSPAVGGSAVVDAQLYRLDQPGVIYREVHVTLRSCV
jgi:uncharacterized membrane protein